MDERSDNNLLQAKLFQYKDLRMERICLTQSNLLEDHRKLVQIWTTKHFRHSVTGTGIASTAECPLGKGYRERVKIHPKYLNVLR